MECVRRLWLLSFLILPGIIPAASLEYYKTFRGNGAVTINAVAADSEGNVYLAGSTVAFDFPVKNAYQARNPGSALIVSEDGGKTWSPLGFIPDLPYTGVDAPVVHPRNSDILLAPGTYGIYRSTDRGQTWRTVVDLNTRAERARIGYLGGIEYDPRDSSVVYAAATGGVLKSTDVGVTWTLLTAGLEPGNCCTGAGIAVDPFQPQRVVYTINDRAYVSLDAGVSWRRLALPEGVRRPFVLIDPHTAGVWYAYSYEGAWRSLDAGSSWTRLPLETRLFRWLVLDPSVPGRLYALTAEGFYRSTAGGLTWTGLQIGETSPDPMNGSSGVAFAVQPGNPDYLVVSGQTTGPFGRTVCLYSDDGGQSWHAMGAVRALYGFQFDPLRPGRLYAAGSPTPDAFVTKLNRDGDIVFSTYLGGQGIDSASAVALDAEGNIYLAGSTESTDFPEVTTSAYPGLSPSLFAAKLDSAGKPVYVTLFGDGANDQIFAAAVDRGGNLHLTGATSSQRFPLTDNAFDRFPPTGGGFAAKLGPDGREFLYSTALMGIASSIAVDPAGNFILAGNVSHPSFPVDPSAPPNAPGQANLLKFDASGALQFARRLPAPPVKALADADGNIIIAATASVADAPPVTEGAFQGTIDTSCGNNSGGLFGRPDIERPRYMTDVYVAKLDPQASSLIFGTFLGGACRDAVTDLALGAGGSVYVAGETYSDPWPSVDSVFGPPPPDYPKPFVARLDADGSRLGFSTYLDFGSQARVALDPLGALYAIENTPQQRYSGTERWGSLLRLAPQPSGALTVRRVVNAFTRTNVPVTPQEIVAIEVPGLLPDEEIYLGLNPPGGAPLQLGGVRVEFNGAPAPILAVHSDDVVCATPAALRGRDLATVQVIKGQARSDRFYVNVAEQSLAFFDQVRNEDGSLNSPDNPARAGSLVTFFFTGAGLPDSPRPDGSIVEGDPPGIPASMDLQFAETAIRLPISELRGVPGFITGLYSAQVRLPPARGTFVVSLFYSTGLPYPPVFPSVSVSVSLN